MAADRDEALRAEMAELPVREFDACLVDDVVAHAGLRSRRRWLLTMAFLLAAGLFGGAFGVSMIDASTDPVLASGSAVPGESAEQQPQPPATSAGDPSRPPSTSASSEPGGPVPAESAIRPSEQDASPESTFEPVDPDDYRARGGYGLGYYFVSPSGNFYCAMTESGAVGCQATVEVGNMPECGTNPRAKAAMVSWRSGDPKATATCTTQGLFTVTPGSGGPGLQPANQVLPYGSSLEIAGNVCESTPAGVSCYPYGTNGGFLISREELRTEA